MPSAAVSEDERLAAIAAVISAAVGDDVRARHFRALNAAGEITFNIPVPRGDTRSRSALTGHY